MVLFDAFTRITRSIMNKVSTFLEHSTSAMDELWECFGTVTVQSQSSYQGFFGETIYYVISKLTKILF